MVIGVAGVMFWEYHKQPEFCATCHIMEPYLETWEQPNYGAYAHAEYDVACLDCHEPTLEQQVHELVVFVTGDYEDPLPEMRYPKEDCYGCHMPESEHETYEQIVERTAGLWETIGANPHDSHYGDMECRLCHKMHRESEDYCAQCHDFGFDVP